MSNYRASVHYNFKNGMADKGLKFLENELIKHAKEMGCHYIEIWQDEKNPNVVVGIATWNSIDDARRFQGQWMKKEHELMKWCAEHPKREFFMLKSSFAEKSKKAA